MSLATCSNCVPRPPIAACTSTCSPGCRRAVRSSAARAVGVLAGTTAAKAGFMPAGRGATRFACARQIWPKPPPEPSRVSGAATLSPTRRPVTPSPRAWMRPAASIPGAQGSGSSAMPSARSASTYPTPAYSARMVTCPGPGVGSGTSWYCSPSMPVYCVMLRAFMGLSFL